MIIPAFSQRDFRRGRISKSSVNDVLVPNESVAECQNVNFDVKIGTGTVRAGTTKVGATVALNRTPLGLTTYSTSDLATNLIVGVFSGASNATVYYYNGSWNQSSTYNGSATLSNTSKTRFASLGGRIFKANGVQQLESSSNGNTWNTTWCVGITGLRTQHIVGLVFRQKNRLLASGDTTFPSRVWFSSVINPANTASAITWNGANTTGDFIDINPDDGDYVTGFGEASDQLLIFKSNAFYRLNVISKSTGTENIYEIGAVSQEAITRCRGLCYFFSGKDIQRTSGGFPEQISRLGVQDFIDAIPQSSWKDVALGADDWNVYASIGNITLNAGRDNQTTYKNVVLKFSTRDESWSVHSYADQFRFFAKYTNTDGRNLIGADITGDVQTLNKGYTDNGTPIFYYLETQDLELGALEHVKEISDKVAVFTNNGQNSRLKISANGETLKDVSVDMTKNVAIGRNINARGNYFKLRWEGESIGEAPEFEGYSILNINDSGVN